MNIINSTVLHRHLDISVAAADAAEYTLYRQKEKNLGEIDKFHSKDDYITVKSVLPLMMTLVFLFVEHL